MSPKEDLWLRCAAIMTITVGLIAAAASRQGGAAPWLLLFDVLSWPLDGEPAHFTGETPAVNAVAGGVMVGWGTLMYLIAKGPLQQGDTTLASPMLIAVIAWFVVDSTGSVAAGLPGNVILNIGFLVLFLPPLTKLRHDTLRRRRQDPGHGRSSGGRALSSSRPPRDRESR